MINKENIILILLFVFVIILLLYLIIKTRKNKESDNLSYLTRRNIDELMQIKKIISQNNLTHLLDQVALKNLEQNKLINNELMKFEDKIIQNMEIKFSQINTKVQDKLESNFKKTDETFTNIIERIAHIDEAQHKLEKLSTNLISLEDILTDKKSRGVFGEISMYNILNNVFGEKTGIYAKQYKLSNGTIVDAVLNCPNPLGLLPIDSKFPLENYRVMVDNNSSESELKNATTLFKNNMKEHILAIHNKYIIPGETSDNAVLFLPSEAVFAEINARHNDIIDFANKNKVWITSPSTLVAFLNNLQMMLVNIERDKYAVIIANELEKLKLEFSRYNSRWEKLIKDINNVSKDAKDIHITSNKITKKFNDISSVNLDRKKLS